MAFQIYHKVTIVQAFYTYYIPPEYLSVLGRRAIPN